VKEQHFMRIQAVNLSTGSVIKSDLDALIEELEAETCRVAEATGEAQTAGWDGSHPANLPGCAVPVLPAGQEPKSCSKLSEHPWPPESLDAEKRFGQSHAKLFPFLGRKVRTPVGPGTLLQVFAHRVTVLLDSQLSKCSFFSPGEIEPVSTDDRD